MTYPLATDLPDPPLESGSASPPTPEPPLTPSVDGATLAALEDIEMRAAVDRVSGAPESVRRRLGLQIEHRDGMTAIRSTGVDSVFFNRLFVSPTRPVERESLEALIRGYATSGIAHYLVHVPPPSASAAVTEWLEGQGVGPYHRHWVKFIRDARPALPAFTDLRVRLAEPRDREAYARILTGAFQIPDAAVPVMAGLVGRTGWHVFVACDGETPVAAAMLFTSGRMSYLSGAATLPSHQRRGAQGALLAARIDAARAAGCEHISAETGVRVAGQPNGSFRNMVRVGLAPAYVRLNYAPRATIAATE